MPRIKLVTRLHPLTAANDSYLVVPAPPTHFDLKSQASSNESDAIWSHVTSVGVPAADHPLLIYIEGSQEAYSPRRSSCCITKETITVALSLGQEIVQHVHLHSAALPGPGSRLSR